MTSLTPHRDALNACLASMRQAVNARAEASARPGHERLVLELSEQLTQVLLVPLVDAFDQEQAPDIVAIQRALTNALASFCSTAASEDPAAARRNARALIRAIDGNVQIVLSGDQPEVSLFQHYAEAQPTAGRA